MKIRICIALITMGFSGLVAEILLLRELLIVFSGNELSIGLILANWLILEALGSFLIGFKTDKLKYKLETFSIITILFSISLLLALFITRILKTILNLSIGESIGFLPMFYSSFLILLPVSMLHGALFPLSCQIFSQFIRQDGSSPGRVYVYETIGTIIGGIICSYLLITHLNSFQASLILALFNFVICFLLLTPFWKNGLLPKIVLVILSILISSFSFLVFFNQADKLHNYAIKLQWKNHHVVHYQNSHYGNICVIENQGQYIFCQDGKPTIITPIPDISFVEEFVHLPLLAHPQPQKLLIMSGGAGGVIHEALKHPTIKTIDYAELDPLLLDLLRKYPTTLTESELYNERVKIKHIDSRLFLKTTRNNYDVIFIGTREVSNLQENRFFTKEFLSLGKERLTKEGIIVLAIPGSLTYRNEALIDLNSCIYNTLKSVFSDIRVFPGDGKHLFLASDSREITRIDRLQIIERLNRRKLKGEVMVPWHIEKKLHHGWQDWITRSFEGRSQKINSDFHPVGLYYSIAYWNALFAPSFYWLFRQFEKVTIGSIFLLCIIFLIPYFIVQLKKKRRISTAIPISLIFTGFAGMVWNLMIIFTFQSMYGNVFSWIGLLMTFFMTGTACGAMLMTSMQGRIKNSHALFIKIELGILFFSLVFPFLLHAISAYFARPEFFILFKTSFLVFSFLCGTLIGSQFPLANKIYLQKNTRLGGSVGLLYAADLLGGWFGGIIGAVVLLPVLGNTSTCFTVGLLKMTSFIIIATQPNQHLRGGKK